MCFCTRSELKRGCSIRILHYVPLDHGPTPDILETLTLRRKEKCASPLNINHAYGYSENGPKFWAMLHA